MKFSDYSACVSIDSDEAFANPSTMALRWFVAHSKPRREKKIVEHCERNAIASTLPCVRSVHKYRGKTVEFQKPLFPGYVFLQLSPEQTGIVRQCNHVANLLEVFDQAVFEEQLQDILTAAASDIGIQLAPSIGEGTRVRIKSGPLEGIEGWVEQRQSIATVLLRLDFINQAAAVKIDAQQLEVI